MLDDLLYEDKVPSSQPTVNRRKIPFVGVKRIVNPGGYRTALEAAQCFLEYNDLAFSQIFRMNKATFHELEGWFACNTRLSGTRYQSLTQKLLIFLYTLAFNEPQRNTAARFKVAQSSVSAVIQDYLSVSIKLAKAFITMPNDRELFPKIELNPKLTQFNGYIGAIDSTHIPIFTPANQRERFIRRKGHTQNVFTAISPAGRIQFVTGGATRR